MSATNKTQNLGLPQYIDTDNFNPLDEINKAFQVIDEEIAEIDEVLKSHENGGNVSTERIEENETILGNHTNEINANSTEIANINETTSLNTAHINEHDVMFNTVTEKINKLKNMFKFVPFEIKINAIVTISDKFKRIECAVPEGINLESIYGYYHPRTISINTSESTVAQLGIVGWDKSKPYQINENETFNLYVYTSLTLTDYIKNNSHSFTTFAHQVISI